ncbi:MAG TPA: hypothetical protein VLL05_07050, partial [Terriglobales bacterium]|nr:hypothetical protein [Terriglobales bacterium]
MRGLLLLLLALGCFALSPMARAADPPPCRGYPNQNSAEGDDALFSLTTGADTTAMAFGMALSQVLTHGPVVGGATDSTANVFVRT